MGKRSETVHCGRQKIRRVGQWEGGETNKHVDRTSLDVLHIVAAADDAGEDGEDEELSPICIHIF